MFIVSEIFKKYSGELNPLGAHRNTRECILEVILKESNLINSIFVYHFLDPDLIVVTFFKKEGSVKNQGPDFEMVDSGTSAHL